MQLFPSASLQRKLSERHTLALAIARRIDRPSYAQLNPLRDYFDATSYRAGNPELVPQTSYNFEVSHTYRQKFTHLAWLCRDRPAHCERRAALARWRPRGSEPRREPAHAASIIASP